MGVHHPTGIFGARRLPVLHNVGCHFVETIWSSEPKRRDICGTATVGPSPSLLHSYLLTRGGRSLLHALFGSCRSTYLRLPLCLKEPCDTRLWPLSKILLLLIANRHACSRLVASRRLSYPCHILCLLYMIMPIVGKGASFHNSLPCA